ncbi:MAG TPA: hypothetical protein P5079_04875 [Elusimicrobiota bacterium]|nr:hypothetical protein [Elusimicrobiota bacterium]
MKVCPQCSAENEPDHNFCERCGDSFLERWEPFQRPRYEALARFSNGARYLARLSAGAGGLCALGVLAYYWNKSLLVAVFFAGAAALAGYLLLVAFQAVAEFIRLFVDIEDHLRSSRDGHAPKPPAPH